MKYNKGFALVTALFLLVILASVAVFTVNISGMNRTTTSFSIQGMRAYFAARSGLEWALYEVTNNPAICPVNTILNLSQGSLQGFQVNITCTVTSFTEGVNNLNIFSLNSFASKGTFGGLDYVSREMQASVALHY